MDSHSFLIISVVIIYAVTVVSAQVALESFRLCIVDEGLPPDLVVAHHSTENATLYAELDYRWNIRPLHTHPLAYFVPRFTSDVQVAVRCARANNIPVTPKSGGHSAELLSYGNAGTIVIAFQNMKKIQINATEKTAVIQSGALLGEIREKLLNEGEFGLSGGICDDVGIGGIALGGGEGHTIPVYNLTADNILEMEMVDSNGDLHLVNENVNSDLFWGLRGVGPGYIGIVTSFKFKLFNATDLRNTHVSFSYELENIGSVLLAYQDFMVWAGKEGLKVMTSLTISGATSQITVSSRLLEEISKGPSRAELLFNKINETFPPLVGQQVSLIFPSYAELGRDWKSIEFPSINTDPATYVKKKSFFVNRTASAEELEKIVQLFQRARNLQVLILYYGYTGPYNTISATDMAFVHRNHLYQVSPRVVADVQISVAEARLALDWLNEYERESKVIDSGESYQNYVDLDLSDNFMERYYGVNSQRLMEIKRKWDPDNYFQNELSIPVKNMAAKSLIILPTSLLCLCLLHVINHCIEI